MRMAILFSSVFSSQLWSVGRVDWGPLHLINMTRRFCQNGFGFGDYATRIYVGLKYATTLVVDRWWFHFSKKLALLNPF